MGSVLITGGAGFVGSNTAFRFLRESDADVVILDNFSRDGSRLNADWLKEKYRDRLRIVTCDIRDFDSLREHVKDCEIIVHAAAQVAVTTSVQDPLADYQVNASGTLNVLEAVRRSSTDPIVLFTSTNKVYGDQVNKIPVIQSDTRYDFAPAEMKTGIPETFPTDASEHTPYGCSKYAADLYVRDYASIYGLRTVTFRMSCIFGTRQFGNEDQGWVAHFAISSVLDRPITLYGDGKQVRDILYVDDLTEAFRLAIEGIAKARGRCFNIGGGPDNTISLLELVDILRSSLKRDVRVSFAEWRPGDQKVYYSDIRAAREAFGWRPTIPRSEGIARLFEWVVGNQELFARMWARI